MTGRATRARPAVAPAVDREAPGSEPAVPGSVPVRPDQEPLADRRGEPADPTASIYTQDVYDRNGRTASWAVRPAMSSRRLVDFERMVNRIEIEVALHLGQFDHVLTP